MLEAIPTEVNYWETIFTQSAIVREFEQDFAPIAAIQYGSPIEFQVKAADHLYRDPNNSKLEVTVKIVLENGNNIANDANVVAPVNLLLHSLFSSIDLEIGGKQITDPHTLYPYKAMMLTMINYPDDVLKTRLACEGWEKDTAGEMDVTNPADGQANTGLIARRIPYQTSAKVRLIGQLWLDLFRQDKLIPPNVDMKLRLIPSSTPFLLKNAAPANENNQIKYRVVIESAKLWIRTKEASTSLCIAHERMLQEMNYRLPYTKVLLKTHQIPIGTKNLELDNVWMGNLPNKVALAMVRNTAIAGSYSQNPFNFQHFGLTHLCLRMNGEQVPRNALAPNFTSQDFKREYMYMLEAMEYDTGRTSWSITPKEWANGYNVYVFRLNSDMYPNVSSVQRTGSVRLEMKFANTIGENISIIFLAEYPAVLEIDKYGQVVG